MYKIVNELDQTTYRKAFAISSWFFLASVPFVSSLLDKKFPLDNGDSRLIWPIHADYILFESENHFYAIAIHFAIVFFIVISLFIAHDTFFVLSVYHVCGMLSVVR